MTWTSNPYLPHSLRGQGAPEEQAPARASSTDVPRSTAAAIAAWAGDDPERAAAALEQEMAETRPRVSLVASLKAVLRRHDVALAVEAPEPESPESGSPESGSSDSGEISSAQMMDMVRDQMGLTAPGTTSSGSASA